MTIQQPHFSGLHQSIGVLQIDSPIAGGLDFGTGQYQAGFKFLKNFVVMKRLTIDSNILTHRPG